MKEKDLQREFGKASIPFGAYELKLEKGNSLSYSRVEEHQIEALRKAKSPEGIYHKIADQTFGRAGGFGHTLKKPFDCMKFRVDNAYVGICFYIPRQKKTVFCIDVDKFVEQRNSDTRKSLTKEKAELISDLKITL